jgi:hypothetical protein
MHSALNEIKLGNLRQFCHGRIGSYEDLIGA